MSTGEVYTVDHTTLRIVLLKDLGTPISFGDSFRPTTSTMVERLQILQMELRRQERNLFDSHFPHIRK